MNPQSPKTDPPRMLEWALWYIALGYRVIALHNPTRGLDGKLWCSCGKYDCPDKGKHPQWMADSLEHGKNSATTDPAIIKKWWRKWPDANIGIRPGEDWFGLDLDARGGGVTTLQLHCEQHGELPLTPQVLSGSGSGSAHYWFKRPPGAHFSSSQGKRKDDEPGPLGFGLDIKTDAGYLVAPPSLHISGNRYQWEITAHLEDTPLAEAPAWMIELLTAPVPGSNGNFTVPDPTNMTAGTGRNPALYALGRALKAKELPRAAIEETLRAYNRRFKEPYSDSAVAKLIEHILTQPDRSEFAADRSGGAVIIIEDEPPLSEEPEYVQAVGNTLVIDDAEGDGPPSPGGYGNTKAHALLRPLASGSDDIPEDPEKVELAEGQTLTYGHSIWFKDVPKEDPEWLWQDHILIGKENLIVGDPGKGKSWASIDLAAHVTTGTPFIDRSPCPKGSVMMIGTEDAVADTMRPRLEAQGGDPGAICHFIIKSRTGKQAPIVESFSLSDHLPLLRKEIIRIGNVKLVVIDPLTAHLGDIDAHKDAAVRAILTPLAELAAELKFALVCIMHLNKAATLDVVYRVTGSIAFVGQARASWAVVTAPKAIQAKLYPELFSPQGEPKDPELPSHVVATQLFLKLKCNLAPPDTPGFAFSIRKNEQDIAALQWLSTPITTELQEIVGGFTNATHAPRKSQGSRGPKPDETIKAQDFLKAFLKDGAKHPSAWIKQAAKAAGITERTLKEAAGRLNVIQHRAKEVHGPGLWSLPLEQKNLDLPLGQSFSTPQNNSAQVEELSPSERGVDLGRVSRVENNSVQENELSPSERGEGVEEGNPCPSERREGAEQSEKVENQQPSPDERFDESSSYVKSSPQVGLGEITWAELKLSPSEPSKLSPSELSVDLGRVSPLGQSFSEAEEKLSPSEIHYEGPIPGMDDDDVPLIRMELPKLPDICPCGHPRREHDHEFNCAHCHCTALRRLALGGSNDDGEVL
jgi:hypothetical protein